MFKILLVDDEALAMDYLQGLISWEKYGFEVAGKATSAKRATDLFQKVKPDVVISDIKMIGMDGLALTQVLKEKNPEIIVILLSAYKDFEYAKKGIQFGVSNYLIKHELNEDVILAELQKVKVKLTKSLNKKKIYQKYFMNQLIYNQSAEEIDNMDLGNRFFLMLIHKNNLYSDGMFLERKWDAAELESLASVLQVNTSDIIQYIADVHITQNNIMILYQISNSSSKSTVNSAIERKVASISLALENMPGCNFNIIYSEEIMKKEISKVFQRMSQQIRYAVFWPQSLSYGIHDLHFNDVESAGSWNEDRINLREQIYGCQKTLNIFIHSLFDLTRYPDLKIGQLRELLHMIENLIREIEDNEGITRERNSGERYKIDEIEEYYAERIKNIQKQLQERNSGQFSKLVQDMTRYINKNYCKDISLNSLGERYQMNGVYLGQIFKKEVGQTFLTYLTNCRLKAAKRLLDDGSLNISEVAEHVGYRSSQYFSRIFTKLTGAKPQEYRRWNRKQ